MIREVRKSSRHLRTAAVAIAVLGMTTLAQAEAPKGMPWFFQTLPENALQGAWDTHKAIMGDKNSAIAPKQKYLIGLAVSAQIPCQYCILAQTELAKKAGATEAELREAVAVGAMIRFWSTVVQGNQTDWEKYKAHFAAPSN